jgi:hypothetical protein
MLQQILRSRSVFVIALGMSLLCSCAYAQGDRNRSDHRNNNRSDARGDNRGDRRESVQRHDNGSRYHYRDGRWYGRGWFGWEFAVAALAVGAMVESLPPRHTTIIVEDTHYYYDDRVYYRQLPDGAYIVVPAPRGR